MVILTVFIASSALSYALITNKQSAVSAIRSTPDIAPDNDVLIDKALDLSVNGYYDQAFAILKPLADKDVTRAKLYLGVAYYHGNGVQRDIKKAKSLFLELNQKQYEPGIVNTYLNMIGSREIE